MGGSIPYKTGVTQRPQCGGASRPTYRTFQNSHKHIGPFFQGVQPNTLRCMRIFFQSTWISMFTNLASLHSKQMMFWSALKAARLYVKPKDNGPVPKEWLRKTTLQAICGKWKVVMHYVCGDGAEWGEPLKFHSLLGKLIVDFKERWPFRCIFCKLLPTSNIMRSVWKRVISKTSNPQKSSIPPGK